jgi:polyphenol oxidase
VTEAFSFLQPINAIAGIRASWVGRIPALSLAVDRSAAMKCLRPHHERAVAAFSGGISSPWWRAEQVHGNSVEIVPHSQTINGDDDFPVIAGCDGLLTSRPGHVLAIYVADCGPIWLADRLTGAVGLLHSGKKGTEQNILGTAVGQMTREFGTCPEDLVAVLGPCIRPPDYETDFAAEIGRQAREAGIGRFHDCGLNTAADLTAFYSYRRESGKTGRMMALITRDS